MKKNTLTKIVFLFFGLVVALIMADRFLTWRFVQDYSNKSKKEAIRDLCEDSLVDFIQIEAAHGEVSIVCNTPHRVLPTSAQQSSISVDLLTITPMLGYYVFVDFKYEDGKLVSTKIIRGTGGI